MKKHLKIKFGSFDTFCLILEIKQISPLGFSIFLLCNIFVFEVWFICCFWFFSVQITVVSFFLLLRTGFASLDLILTFPHLFSLSMFTFRSTFLLSFESLYFITFVHLFSTLLSLLILLKITLSVSLSHVRFLSVFYLFFLSACFSNLILPSVSFSNSYVVSIVFVKCNENRTNNIFFSSKQLFRWQIKELSQLFSTVHKCDKKAF